MVRIVYARNMAVCPQCREPVGLGQSGLVFGYAFARDENGDMVKDSEVEVGLFRPHCWSAWKAKHLPSEDEPPDHDQMIEDIGGGPPGNY